MIPIVQPQVAARALISGKTWMVTLSAPFSPTDVRGLARWPDSSRRPSLGRRPVQLCCRLPPKIEGNCILTANLGGRKSVARRLG